jgi:hypothetical protein
MRTIALLALVFLCGTSLSCGGGSLTKPMVHSRLDVHVYWDGLSLADRRLEIVELGLVRWTDANGIARFPLPAGSYTLRAFVNAGGPAGFFDLAVTTRPGEIERVEVPDCLPCVGAR